MPREENPVESIPRLDAVCGGCGAGRLVDHFASSAVQPVNIFRRCAIIAAGTLQIVCVEIAIRRRIVFLLRAINASCLDHAQASKGAFRSRAPAAQSQRDSEQLAVPQNQLRRASTSC